MDNTKPAQPVIPPVVPVSDQSLTLDPNLMTAPTAPQQPVAQPQYPVGGPHKEMAPVTKTPISEVMRPTEVQPQLQPEVQEAGVEVVENREQPQLTAEHKAVGIEHAKESVPMPLSPQPTVQLPYSLQDAKVIGKQVSRYESKHWLAALTEYIWRKFQAVTAQ